MNRFHKNLYASLGSRLIERSPLPFGRPRWVQPVGSLPPIRRAEHSRPRAELMDWSDELARLPIDPERGPGWYLAVQPLDDGSTAASIIASHVIGDGVGALMAVIMRTRSEAALARACDLGVAMQLTNIARDVGEDACALLRRR